MKLRVFRSLNEASRRAKSGTRLAKTSGFDGIVATANGEIPGSETAETRNQRWICQFYPKNASAAMKQLDQMKIHNIGGSASLPDMIVFHHSTLSLPQESLPLLRELLPMSASFLESHKGKIAGKYGRLNAHGQPLNDHVIGICHHFPTHNVLDLAILLDFFLPTRLALSASNFRDASNLYDDVELEAVVHNSDVVYGDLQETNNSQVCEEVWKAQQQDGAMETYAICHEDEEALRLRQHYDKFLQC